MWTILTFTVPTECMLRIHIYKRCFLFRVVYNSHMLYLHSIVAGLYLDKIHYSGRFIMILLIIWRVLKNYFVLDESGYLRFYYINSIASADALRLCVYLLPVLSLQFYGSPLNPQESNYSLWAWHLASEKVPEVAWWFAVVWCRGRGVGALPYPDASLSGTLWMRTAVLPSQADM